MGICCASPETKDTVELAKVAKKKIKFFDAHFHIMDHYDPESPHLEHVKAHSEKWKTYVMEHHEKMITGHGDPVELIGGCFMEVACPPELKHKETEWVDK